MLVQSIVAILLGVLVFRFALQDGSKAVVGDSGAVATTIFDFSVPDSDGTGDVSLTKFKGKKAYLVVNVASKCGLTAKNYDELNVLYTKYKEQGLEILGFPCNNFLSQEPGTNDDIQGFCRSVGATFPVLGKVECENGAKTHPLYQFLKSSISGILGQRILWNFAKFLCDENGVPVKRFGPSDNPLSFENAIIELLEKK